MKPRRTYVLYLAVFFCIVFAGGFLVGHYSFQSETSERVDVSESGTSYKFINPLLFCNDQNMSNQGASNLEQSVSNYLNQEENTGDIIDGAFYFKDLNGGPWALVNPDYQSAPASLLKIPIAISVYQKAEEDPNFLSMKVTAPASIATNNADQGEHFAAPVQAQAGQVYTVADLVRLMLQYSDNNALDMLGNLFTLQELQDSYTHLGIQAPSVGDSDGSYTMNVQTLASFFRVLYSATYLTQADSEAILSTLSQSTFTEGIVAGLPSGIVVSHKFGEFDSPDGTIQLSDCGIVYKPNQPYLLCILTKGTSYDALTTVISHISQMTYQEINSSD